MHERHDLDLVSALAQGSLEDPTPAEELIESCPECAEAYEAHLRVMEAVRREVSPRLSPPERRNLRAAVWANVEPAAAPTPPAATRISAPWWYRVVGAAAVIAAFVAVGAVLVGDRSGGDTATVGQEPFASETTDTEALAPFSADTNVAMDGEAESDAGGAVEDATASDTTAAGSTAAAESDERASTRLFGFFSRGDLPDATEAFTHRVREGEAATDPAFECHDRVDSEQLVAVEAADVEGQPVWFVALGALDDPTVEVLSQDDCSLVFPNG